MSKQLDFINQVKDGAVASMVKHKVCASVTIAQAILESGWNSSTLSKEHFNLFGVKADKSWTGKKAVMSTAEYTRNNQKYFIDAAFRKYGSFAESIEDHALFLVNNSRYKQNGLFNSLDYKKQTAALQSAGYATIPTYSKMLNDIIEQYKLHQYDKQEAYPIKFRVEAIVTASALNVRTIPVTGAVVKQFKANDKITLIDYNMDKSWGCTTLGWVSMAYVKIIK
jgi:flagellum-specific peptidoglycan hydrolase FlgJ